MPGRSHRLPEGFTLRLPAWALPLHPAGDASPDPAFRVSSGLHEGAPGKRQEGAGSSLPAGVQRRVASGGAWGKAPSKAVT